MYPDSEGGAKLILHLTSPTDRPGCAREPGFDPVRSDRPTRSGPLGGGDVGPGRADRPTRLAGRPGRRAGSGEADRDGWLPKSSIIDHAKQETSNMRWLSVETIGRALSRYFQIVSVRDVWPDAATNALSLVPPLFAIDAAPQTPPRPAPPADEYHSYWDSITLRCRLVARGG